MNVQNFLLEIKSLKQQLLNLPATIAEKLNNTTAPGRTITPIKELASINPLEELANVSHLESLEKQRIAGGVTDVQYYRELSRLTSSEKAGAQLQTEHETGIISQLHYQHIRSQTGI
jgi:hypothetical protein